MGKKKKEPTCKHEEQNQHARTRRITRFTNLLPKFEFTGCLDQCSKPEYIRVRISIVVIILSDNEADKRQKYKIR